MFKASLNTLLHHYGKHPKRYTWIFAIFTCYSILGFFIAPWIIEKQATKFLLEEYDTELSIDKFQLNPFAFSTKIIKLKLNDPNKDSLLQIEEITVNFQLSSIFNRALTFAEFTIISPEIFIARSSDNTFNFSYFIKPSQKESVEPNTFDDSNIFPVIVHKAVLQNAVLNFTDEVPSAKVSTVLTPINIEISNFSTLVNDISQHSFLVTTENNGTLNWDGKFSVNPLSATGHISLDISEFPLIFSYLKDAVGIDVPQGQIELGLDYTGSYLANEELNLELTNANLDLSNISAQILNNFNLSPEILTAPSISLRNGSFIWPQGIISADELALQDTRIDLQRLQSGMINILTLPILATEPSTSSPTIDDTSPQWSISLTTFAINNLSIGLQDFTVEPVANLGLNDLNLKVENFNVSAGSQFPINLNSNILGGGSINLEGQFSINPDFNIALETNINELNLSSASSYLQSLISLDLESGLANFSGQLNSQPDEALDLNGSLNITNFAISEPTQGSALVSWNELAIDNMAVTLSEAALEFSEILIDGLYGDVVISESGKVNLGEVNSAETSETSSQTETSETSNTMVVNIGKITIQNSGADFADHSLPLPFSAKIAELNGNISTISSSSLEPVEAALEGTVDEFGLVRINGFLTPFDINSNTDLSVSFQNVDIPKFSAYMIPFAGREINSGRLDLDLVYKVTDNLLDSESNIVLRDFNLGNKVPHAGAASLPLDLAVALLKNPQGNIDLNLPVSGDTNDPEFSFSSVILQVFSNIIVKLVTSPFSLLANLVGIEGNELEHIEFLPGQATLSPPEIEKSLKLAEALALRPELILQLSGAVDPQVDGAALKELKLETIIESEIAELIASESNDDMYTQQQKIVLEKLFNNHQQSDPLFSPSLVEIQAQFTSPVEPQENEAATQTQFDNLAYMTELKRLLLDLQTISNDELEVLGNERANNARTAILSQPNNLMNRISLLENSETQSNDDATIQMKVSLTQKATP